MKLIKTLILFVIFAALGAYVYFYEIKGGEEREKQAKLEEQLFNFEKDSVKSVEIRSVFNRFHFTKTENGWKIIQPVETEGDKSTIDGLITTMKGLKKNREFVVEKDEYKNYGLVGTSYLVILEFNDGTRDSVRFGDQTPVGSNVFVTKGDTFVYTVPQHNKNTVTKKLFDWRDKSVAKIKQSEVREFKLKNKKGKFHLVKESGKWNIESPKKISADESAVNAILRKFENGRAKSVVSESLDNLRKYRLNRPEYEIDLYLGESKAHKKIIFSSLENNVSNGKDDSRPHVFTVDSLFLKDINKSLFDLRNKKLTNFIKDNIDSAVVYQGDSTVVMVKDTSNNWQFKSGEKIKSWKISSFLNTINNLRAKKFVKEKIKSTRKYGLDKPLRQIQLYQNNKLINEILIGEKRDANRIVFCPQTEIVAEVQNSSLTNTEVKYKDFVEEKKTNTEEDSD